MQDIHAQRTTEGKHHVVIWSYFGPNMPLEFTITDAQATDLVTVITDAQARDYTTATPAQCR
ncbi:hypothetical protein ACNO8X_18385 [Mycobacterium sp. PDNC021]|uniref:hypothetical protein n=1 Tax=Mycobacterium sp. PDNC021 TaxID=3391399 RepID=UPI003AAD6E32